MTDGMNGMFPERDCPPVLLIVFNRPDTTRRVFEAIRKARPSRLFVAADGPRDYKEGESERCRLTREVATAVDWECEVQTLFRDTNLGCGRGPSSAITWFFQHVESGIILEDDCLPTPEFFSYCGELLERYRHDERIMNIGGCNFLPSAYHDDSVASYYFSKHGNTWGWATWRRAWKLYDYSIKRYKSARQQQVLNHSYNSLAEREYFLNIFDRTYNNVEDITWWDYQWEFLLRTNSGLTIVPNKNLVVNIGFGENATHTTNTNSRGAQLKAERLSLPLKHPDHIVPDYERDSVFFRDMKTTFRSRIKFKIKTLVPKVLITLFAFKGIAKGATAAGESGMIG